MQKNKIYSLKLNINLIQSDLLTQHRKYSLKLSQNSLQKCTPLVEAHDHGKLAINQCIEFSILEGELDRDSKCLIQLCEENREEAIEEIGRFELIVMEYKNYSKKVFKMASNKNGVVNLHMAISINSDQERKSTQKVSKPATNANKSEGKQRENGKEIKWMKDAVFESPVSVNSQISEFSEFSQKSPKQRDEAVAMSRHPFQMDKIFKYIGGKTTAFNAQFQKKQTQSSVNALNIPNINIKESIEDDSRAIRESRYCKQLQQELDYFSSKNSNNEIEGGFFDSLHRIKNRFEKIHEDEELLNSDDLYNKEQILNDQKKVVCYLSKLQEKKRLKINTCFSYKLHLGNAYDPKGDSSHLSARKRYQIAKVGNISPFNETIIFKHNACLSESQLNFEVQQESLNRVSYIKLNKISHLTRAADIAKKNNSFLIQANEQLKLALKVAEQKLEISKSIISQKEEILQSEFKAVKEYIRSISNKLSLGHEQSKKREEKIAVLQQQVEQYTRQINTLKADIKANNITIKDLKSLLSLKEEKDEPSISMKETAADTKEIRNRVARINGTKDEEHINPLYISYSTEKRPNSVRLFQDGKVRKKSSIENEIKVTEVEDKSDAGSQKTFRRFSRSKIQSHSVIQQKSYQSYRTGTYLKTDDIFNKINELLLGNSEERVLKNL